MKIGAPRKKQEHQAFDEEKLHMILQKTREMTDSYEKHIANLTGAYENKIDGLRDESKIKDRIIDELRKRLEVTDNLQTKLSEIELRYSKLDEHEPQVPPTPVQKPVKTVFKTTKPDKQNKTANWRL